MSNFPFEKSAFDMELEITARRSLTAEIEEFTLAASAGDALPAAEAGAHITLETPSGAMRRYSLIRPDSVPTIYTIAVKREVQSRGGSVSMHEAAGIGHRLMVEPPRNDFALSLAHPALLVAGGIGITPIYAMAQKLVEKGRAFRAIYCTRSAAETAYAREFAQLCGDRLTLHHDGGDPDAAFDFWETFETPTAEHVYCCGPAPLMEEVKAVSGHWREGTVHFEDFRPVEVVRADDAAFTVVLAKSGIELAVPADRTILEALRDAGYKTVSSCESGACGTCKTPYLQGEVDHRDMVLRGEEKTCRVMICVSRAKGGRLVLDL
ncbi:MAG: PDR/VanB family oxidoreductase [Rhodospirillaceae bacterium]|nr:PDR/VanB family oxidoreductase [Rhodospirillaceae bacterium]